MNKNENLNKLGKFIDKLHLKNKPPEKTLNQLK